MPLRALVLGGRRATWTWNTLPVMAAVAAAGGVGGIGGGVAHGADPSGRAVVAHTRVLHGPILFRVRGHNKNYPQYEEFVTLNRDPYERGAFEGGSRSATAATSRWCGGSTRPMRFLRSRPREAACACVCRSTSRTTCSLPTGTRSTALVWAVMWTRGPSRSTPRPTAEPSSGACIAPGRCCVPPIRSTGRRRSAAS